MLIWFVIIYLLISIGIGHYAAALVRSTENYADAANFFGPLFVPSIHRVKA